MCGNFNSKPQSWAADLCESATFGSRRQFVDARKDGYQPLLIDPAADKPTTQPGVEKLLSRHDTVLSAGELNDDLGGIRSSRIHSQNIDRRRIKDGALK